jgi:uncharacterized protein YkwD
MWMADCPERKTVTRPSPRAFITLLVALAALAACGQPKPRPVSLDAGRPAAVAPSPELTAPPVTAPPTAPPTAAPTPSKTRSVAPKRAQSRPGDSTGAQAVLDQTNAWRVAAGLPPYKMSTGLVASAHKHNLAMAAGCGLSHRCAGEADLGDRIRAEGVKWSAAGENCGVGNAANTSAAITKAAKGLNQAMFDEKPPADGHRRNLLSSSFTQIGIDVVRDSKGKVWLTEDFAR